MKKLIATYVNDALTSLGIPDMQPEIVAADTPAHGDFTTNIALKLSKTIHKNPIDLGKEISTYILEHMDPLDGIASIEVVPPGFINFFISPVRSWSIVPSIIEKGSDFGKKFPSKRPVMVIDYSAPNIAKRFSIGHLRSTIVGNALERLYEHLGWDVISDNHLGDWGTQFGKMIVAIRKWTDGKINAMSIEDLEALYVKFHTEAEVHPELDDEARLTFKKLEDGSIEEKTMWRQLITLSMTEFNKIYAMLKVNIDETIGESFYESIMKDVIATAKEKGIAKQDKGAWMIHYPGDALPPSMLIKSDGGTTYLTRDLATIKYRQETWAPKKIVYEVGGEQALHFKQVFWASEMLGFIKKDALVHVGHGMIRLPEGKMSTRKGRTVKLEEVLTKAIEKAREFTTDESIAKIVGIGAVKYNDLRHAPVTGYTFTWDEALNLVGNSGPYIQYTYVRCKSIFDKYGKDVIEPLPIDTYPFSKDELEVVRMLSYFEEILIDAADTFSPNTLCNYIFALSQSFNSMYNTHSILNAENKESKFVRLSITKAVMIVINISLTILGIDTPSSM